MLELADFPVRAIRLGERTAYDGSTLTVGESEVAALCAGPALAAVRLGVAAPGEPARVINVLDVVEPRVKAEGPGDVFPGLLGPVDTVGRGRTHRLAGAAVVATGVFPDPTDPFLGQKDCVIEMTGPGAPYSPFGATCNLVLEFTAADGVGNLEFGNAVRLARLRAARHLALATLAPGPAPAATRRYDPQTASADCPRVVYICETVSHGPLKSCYLYGREFTGSFPTLVGPAELQDGCLVSGEYHYAGQRTTTYLLQNNPVVEQLWAGHGKTHQFVAVVLSGIYRGDREKDQASQHAAELARLVGARGAVISAAAGGNALVDALYLGRACERRGIKSAVILYEMSSAGGDDPSLVDFTPENDLMISTGNREQLLDLPAPQAVLGGRIMVESGAAASGPLRLPVRDMCAATCHQGAGRLTGRAG